MYECNECGVSVHEILFSPHIEDWSDGYIRNYHIKCWLHREAKKNNCTIKDIIRKILQES
ncbi:unnamed protein product [marine sediment metagenome]|uniref:Uncharacterized protein n=1 Tax=marine sediment metagenome TaxID=412755 RepID=X1A3R5_9ZZZZ